jgi:hypothetical protein
MVKPPEGHKLIGYPVNGTQRSLRKNAVVLPANPYLESHQKPKLLNSYCAFVHVLGFSEQTNDAFAASRSEQFLQKYYAALRSRLSFLPRREVEEAYSRFPCMMKVFTDRIVLGYPLASTDGQQEFGQFVRDLSYFQLSMSLHGFFVRGALALGELFMDEQTVFGPALRDAYETEKDLAVEPRIVLGSSLKALKRRHLRPYSNAFGVAQNQDLLVDADGVEFVNYLDLLVNHEVNPPSAFWREVGIHRQNIESNLRFTRLKPRIWSKYFWLVNYHNYFCDALKDLAGYSPACYVNPRLY